VPLEPIHRSRYRADPDRDRKPDRAAAAIRGARLGAILAAAVAVVSLFFGRSWPFDAQYLVIAAFVAPILLALFRPRG
jgi:hypothetical protein